MTSKFFPLLAIVGVALTSAAFADAPTGTFAVYFVAYNHDSQPDQALRSLASGTTLPLGNDGYVVESGSLSDLLLSIWSNVPGQQVSDLTQLGIGSSALGALIGRQNGTVTSAFCNMLEPQLSAPNSLARGINFSAINACSVDSQPKVMVTSNGQSSLHLALTMPKNQVRGILTTPAIVVQSEKHFNPPWADPCTAETFGFTAETDITVSATSFSVGKWKGSFTAASPPSDCSPPDTPTNFNIDSPNLPGFFTRGSGQALAQAILDSLPLATLFAADISAIDKNFVAQTARVKMTPHEWNGNGSFGYFFLQQDPPNDFSGSLKGAVHIDNSLALELSSCSNFKLTSDTRIGAVVPTSWDHGPSYDDPKVEPYASYGTVRFSTDKPVSGPTDATCAFTMTGLPLGYDTTFIMTGGIASGTTMSLELPKDLPLHWNGETIVAAASTGDFQMTQGPGVDVSDHVGTGVTAINAGNSAAILRLHGGGGDPAQDATIAKAALLLDPHDYASLATLANANFRLGKTNDARTQLIRAISLAIGAHDLSSAAKFQTQLTAMGR